MDSVHEPDRSGDQNPGDRIALRWLILLYVLLLLFEGALRKWVLPGWSKWLLLVRDPVVILIYLVALAEGVMVVNRWLVCAALVVGTSFVASVATGHPLLVTMYGLRTDLLHLPLIFLLPRVLTERDVWNIGRLFVWLVAPMTVLATLQFVSSRFSWINVGAGGEIGGQLLAVEGKMRASGTFSFVTGMASFLSLAAAFLLAGSLEQRRLGRVSRWLAIPSLVLALGIVGSRAALAAVCVVFAAFVLAGLLNGMRALKVFALAALVFAAYAGLTFLPVFREGVQVQQERFAAGGGVQKGIILRYLGQLGESLEAASYAPPFGQGLGLGTNVAADLMTGHREFLLAEGEWARVVLESGPVLGFGYILLRLVLACSLAASAWRAARLGRPSAMVLLGACFLDVMSGQFGQPTELGFAVFGAALTLTLASVPVTAPAQEVVPQPDLVRVRGRGVFAEMLQARRHL